jgi:hypothetical protein
MGKRKRQHSRVSVSLPATMVAGAWSVAGKVENISLTGALVHCTELPNLNERLRLQIELPDHGYTMVVHAKIIRLDIHHTDEGGPAYDLGVTFIDISEEDLKFLSNKVLH